MNFYSPPPFENSLTKFIKENPDASYEDIISHTDLSVTVRNEADELVNFIIKPENIKKALEYIFDNSPTDNSDILRVRRNTVSIFSSVSFKLQELLKDNADFSERFSKFPTETQLHEDYIIFGNFTRIVETQTRFSNGEFLKKIDGICPFLIKHVHKMASRELLTRVITDFLGFLDEATIKSLITELIEGMKGENAYFIVTMIRDAVREKSALIPYFQKRDMLTPMFEIAIQTPTDKMDDLVKSEIFILLDILLEGKEVMRGNLIAKFEKSFKFDKDNLSCAMISSLRIFSDNVVQMLPRFFESPPITMLNETILSVLRKLDDETLVDFVRSNKILAEIQSRWDTEKLNGHMFELAVFLAGIPLVVQNCRGWFKFRDTQLHDYQNGPRLSRLKIKPKIVQIQSQATVATLAFIGPKVYFIDDTDPLRTEKC